MLPADSSVYTQQNSIVVSWQTLTATEDLFPYLVMKSEHIQQDLWVSDGLVLLRGPSI